MTQNSINSKQPLIQSKYTVLTSAVTINAAIPIDNSVPQITEGVEVMTCTITPTKATNLLVVKAFVWGYASNFSNLMIALFQDATSNALAATMANYSHAAAWISLGSLYYTKVAGTTSATTFKIRCGRDFNNFTINKAEFGGVQNSYIEVMEIKA